MTINKKNTIITTSLLLFTLLMIGAVSAASDANATSQYSDATNTHISPTDTNTAIDKMNSANNDNIINEENKDPKIEDTKKSSIKDVESEKIDTRKLQSGTTKNEAKIKVTDEIKSFTDLKNNITNSVNNITLYDDYEFKDSDSELKKGIIIDKIFTIYGNGKTINANNGARIFNVTTTGSLTLINLTFINGNNEFAGAIYNKGNLTIINSTLKQNTADTYGGAIYTRGNLTIINSTLTNNTSHNEYAGAILQYEGFLNIINSTIANNTAKYGGAIYNKAKLTIIHSNLTNNQATYGGAIYNNNDITTIINTTLTNNQAIEYPEIEYHKINGDGGAIYNNNGTLTIMNTILKNNKIRGRGIYLGDGGAIHIRNGNTFIKNSTFINTTAINHGGAIYINDGLLNIADSQFINTTAINHGGAIYIQYGQMNITDSQFINNTAYSCGGAIAYENDADFDTISNIQRVQIINATSIDDAGGAIYLKHTIINMNDVNITSSRAIFGGAITSLKTNLKMSNSNIINSTAEYYGGAIYQMYGNLYVTNSTLLNTGAINGGAFYIVLNENLTITDNKFNNNHADNKGNVIYLLLNQTTLIQDNTYNNQTNPMLNDLYETSDVSGFIGNNNYTLYHINYTELPETYPDHYDLRELNLTTPVKNQNRGGNCWAFSAIGSLESTILKAGGESLDLSEENLKNIMALYSIYGWNSETNIYGGHYLMTSGYLTSWLGPVYEYEDLYDDSSTLSPILNSMTHIQNIVYITRYNNEDNNIIKEALMKYGALGGTAMYWDNQYLNHASYYYNGSENADHGVAIVGWDDNYPKENFKGNPKDNGAWIIKNSWGTTEGENGYFYVSYYDTTFAITYPSYAIILNDTIKYDKNYQYDIQGFTNIFLNSSNTAWYKNVFNSTDDEYLAAVSTYFYKDADWELTIKVNDIIKCIQSGSSQSGYYTLNLNQMIPLNIGDIFEVIFKITMDGTAEIPISEGQQTNVRLYKENTSFVSYDGLNWQDLYDLKWSYNHHDYSSQVACIKAFTILNAVNTQLSLDITNITESTVDLIATVYNEYGYLVDSGNVTFTIGDKKETVAVQKGIAKLNTLITSRDVSAQFEAIGYNTSTTSQIIDTLIPSKIELSKYPIISAYISDLEGKAINSGFVIFNDGFENYTVDVVNGFANLTDILLELGENQITATYKDLSDYYKSCNKTITITLNKTSYRYLNQQIQEALNNNQNNITLNWDYKYDNETDYKFIKGIPITNKFTIYGNNHTINGNKQGRIFLINGNGDLTLENLAVVNGRGQNETLHDGSVWNVGGAIYVNGTILTINNCNFTQNTLSDDEFGEGGAIYTGHNSQLNINNTIFNHNKAAVGGAVFINTNSKLNINNTLFTNNNVTYDGGAIIGNTKSHININNSIFTSNNAKEYGGAVFIHNNSYLNINNTQFTNNTSINNGGAVHINNYANNTISNTNFTQNTVISDDFGGAISTGPKTNIFIYNCNFNKNNAGYAGGAIHIMGEATIIKSTFTQNNATYGGAIYSEEYSTVNINKSTFTQNNATYGGAIYAGENSTVNINKSTFTQNNATYGGAILAYNATMTINESTFTQNNATYAGAVYTEEYTIIHIINTNFINNNATYGGAIYTNASSKTTLINNNITQNNAIIGGAIHNENSDLTIIDSLLRNNMADIGGAIYSNGTTNITKSFLMDNQANNGAEIFATTPLIMNDNIIINNKTQKSIQGTIIGDNNQIYDNQINYLLNVINEKEKEIQNLNNTLNNATNDIKTLTQTIKDQNNTIKTLTDLTNNLQNTITKLNKQISKTENKKLTTKIIAKNKKYRTKTKVKKYTITLKSGNKAITKAKITLKIKGKTYTTTTNKKGKATFKITTLNKKGKYTAKINYKGNNNYNKINKTVKITIKE